MAFLRFIIKALLMSILILALTLSIAAVSVYYHLEKQLPDVEKLKEVHLQVPLRVYSADKKLIAQFGTKRRVPVNLNQVPKMLIAAVLATEDSRFYKHSGVDLIGIGRATFAVIGAGRKVQGASTITMQVARNFYLSREKTYMRKIREILLALKIDKELDKDKILELYLNKIYFGNRAYGVAAAAQVYFGKTLNQLTLAQMAMIAGLPQAPSRNNPIENPESALKRRNHVLARMMQLGYIKNDQYQKAIEEPLTAEYHAPTVEVSAPYIAEMVREAMVEEYGDAAYERGLTVYTTLRSNLQRQAEVALRAGLMAYDQRHGYRRSDVNLGEFDQERWQTDLQKQNIVAGVLLPAAVLQILPQSVNALLASGEIITIPWSGLSWARLQLEDGFLGAPPKSPNEIVKVGDVIRVVKDGHEWRISQIPQVQGAIVALDPQNGAILALSGGFDYNASNFNRAIQAERQPGSNFKPFIYSAALNKGYTLASVINDAPIVEKDSGENKIWRPTNDTMKFYGPTPLRVGLVQSRNLVSIRLLQDIGVQYALHYLQRFGFDPNVMPHGLTLALGTGSATPLQIAVGYSVFANGGYLVTPYFIQKILDQHENVLYQADPAYACNACLVSESPNPKDIPVHAAPKVISPQNAYLITQALKDVIQEGTGKRARILNRTDLAGKTGTTNDQVDAWFSGFNSHLVTTVWVGYDNMKGLNEYGADAALPIWIQFMHEALKDIPQGSMPEPPNIVTMRVDPNSDSQVTSREHAKFEVFSKENPSNSPSGERVGDDGDRPPANSSEGGSEEQIF